MISKTWPCIRRRSGGHLLLVVAVMFVLNISPAFAERNVLPGLAVGKLSLGMSQDDVRGILGAPGQVDNSLWNYTSSSSGNLITLHWINGTLSVINFTSDSFESQEGVNTSNAITSSVDAGYEHWQRGGGTADAYVHPAGGLFYLIQERGGIPQAQGTLYPARKNFTSLFPNEEWTLLPTTERASATDEAITAEPALAKTGVEGGIKLTGASGYNVSAATPTPPAASQVPSSAAAADANGGQTSVVVQGIGIDETSALKNAFARAVEQAVGMLISAETIIKNEELVKEQILTYSDAYVTGYDTISSVRRDDGLHEVRIAAKVERKQLVDKIKTLQISTTEVDTTSYFAQIKSKQAGKKDAASLLRATLARLDYPASYIQANLLSNEPEIAEVAGRPNMARVTWAIELSLDEERYFREFVPQLMTVLDQIATERPREQIWKAELEDGFPFAQGLKSRQLYEISSGSRILYLVNRINKTATNNSFQPYIFEEEIWNELIPWLGTDSDPVQCPDLRVNWVSEDDSVLLQSTVSLTTFRIKYNSYHIGLGGRIGKIVGPFYFFALNGTTALEGQFGRKVQFRLSEEVDVDELKDIAGMRLELLAPQR